MLTVAEVQAIYAGYAYEVTDKEVADDIAHAMGDNPTYAKFMSRIHGYANQMMRERQGDAAEAAEFQSHYD